MKQFAVNYYLLFTFFCIYSLNAQITSYPYVEDFETGAAGWTVQGTNPSWELDFPSSFEIIGAASGYNAWITNKNGYYNNNESNWIESPVFDLSTLTTPTIQFAIWWDLYTDDGVVLQSTIDSGVSWQNVGAYNDDVNWFNDSSINSNPGGQPIGWSGYNNNGSNGWVTAIHSLSNLTGQTNVIFRVAFSSNSSFNLDGFAFDLFSILDNPCYAGEDNSDTFCSSVETVNLTSYLSLDAFTGGDWSSESELSISESGEVDFTNAESITYEFTYSVYTELGACVDDAIISITVEKALFAGDGGILKQCIFPVTEQDLLDFQQDLLDFLDGADKDGEWDPPPTDPDFGKVGIYTYTHQATSICTEEVSATVTVVEVPEPNAGSEADLNVGLNVDELTIDLDVLREANSRTVLLADPGIWTLSPDSENYALVSEDGEVDFPNTGAGAARAISYTFTYTTEANICGIDSTVDVNVLVTGFNIDEQGTTSICENEVVYDETLFGALTQQLFEFNGEWTPEQGIFGAPDVYTYDDGSANTATVTVTLDAFAPKVFLQGAMLNPNTGEENLMRDDLRVLGYIPTISPYGDASCDASVFNTIGNDAIVDWVFIELRSAGNNTYIVTSQSALLQRDGDIVDVDGISALCLNISKGNYYVVVKHRNHLGIMSANTIGIGLDFTKTVVDFTNTNLITYGTDARTSFGMPVGVLGIWTGDTIGLNQSQFSGSESNTAIIKDYVLGDPLNSFLSVAFISQGYLNIDINMDGMGVFSGSQSDSSIVKDNVLAHPSNAFGSIAYTILGKVPEN